MNTAKHEEETKRQVASEDQLKDYEERLMNNARPTEDIIPNSSRIKVDDSNIPPFLRRLQNK